MADTKANPSGAGADPGVPHLDEPDRREWTVTLDDWAEFEDLVRSIRGARQDARDARDGESAAMLDSFVKAFDAWERDILRRHWDVPTSAAAARLVGSREEPSMEFIDAANEQHKASNNPTDEPVTPWCDGNKHYWPPDYCDGDTCQCGSFYLDRMPAGGMRVEARNDNG